MNNKASTTEEWIRRFPEREGLLALSYVLDEPISEILRHPTQILSPAHCQRMAEILQDRHRHRPLQYALGIWEFYGRSFHVDERALIPRPETERLVELVLQEGTRGCHILDLGTGSGIIPLTIALEGQAEELTGSDISRQALDLAKENEQFLRQGEAKTLSPIHWIQSDLFENLPGRYDLLISNPPYVEERERGKLQKELSYEPETALFAGDDGLDFYRRLAGEAGDHLRKGGRIFLEIGDQQGASVKELFKTAGFADLAVIQDYTHRDRILRGVWPEEKRGYDV